MGSRLLRTPGEETLADALGRKPRFNLLLELSRLPTSLLQIDIDLLTMPEVVRDHRVHVGELQRRILEDDLLGRAPVVERADHRIQCYACSADTNDAILVYLERWWLCGERL